jgi:hypothetical protein
LGRTIFNRPTFPERTEELPVRLAQFNHLGNGSRRLASRTGRLGTVEYGAAVGGGETRDRSLQPDCFALRRGRRTVG